MKIEQNRISLNFNRQQCYVHSRGLILDNGFGIITTQKLELNGEDVFYGIELMKSFDGGKTFSLPVASKNLKRTYNQDKTSVVMCDATPFFHKKTGKIILVGHSARYSPDNALVDPPRKRDVTYSVYNENEQDFEKVQNIDIPNELADKYFSIGAGCAQILELESGELLIPVYFMSYEDAFDPYTNGYSVTVLRCDFDGKTITIKEIGNEITITVPRGLCEPSITKIDDKFLLCLRNDKSGYVCSSKDGLHYTQPKHLCFDNGENAGNYNTQQHWITTKDKAYLVYTRRAETNSHVFRHRAPLFIAEFDVEKECLIKETEKIAVPERGARLGNFGCQSFSDKVGYVFASEWMQGDNGLSGCEEHGSDNSLFITKIHFE